jgi:intracellular sulfur oxidation DsrE/DsrF family protein
MTLRRSFLTRFNIGLAATAGAAMAAKKNVIARWHPARHEKDDWLDENAAKHRLLFDSMNFEGLGEALAFASNIYLTNELDYGMKDHDLAVVVVLRHRSALFGYNDAMWAKYGEPMAKRAKLEDPRTKHAPVLNMYNAASYGDVLLSRGITLGGLAAKGVQFAVCNLSTHAFADVIGDAVGAKGDDIYNELKANLIQNARLVPAGIVAVNRAQERGYTLMSV